MDKRVSTIFRFFFPSLAFFMPSVCWIRQKHSRWTKKFYVEKIYSKTKFVNLKRYWLLLLFFFLRERWIRYTVSDKKKKKTTIFWYLILDMCKLVKLQCRNLSYLGIQLVKLYFDHIMKLIKVFQFQLMCVLFHKKLM